MFHFTQDTPVAAHEPQALDAEDGRHRAAEPVLWKISLLFVGVPALDPVSAGEIHLCPQ